MRLKIGITKTFVIIAFATMSFGPWYFGNLVAFAADPSLAQKRFCVGELFRRAMGRPTPIEQIMTEIRESVQILDPKFGSVQVDAGLREIPLTAGDKNTRGVRGIAFSAEAKHWDADLQKATAR